MRKKIALLKQLGPGLITGASDEDPCNIATYSQIGAQFGYGLLWTTWLLYPLMMAIQEISSRIGRVTGQGLTTNIRRFYSRRLLYGIVLLLTFANTINLGADLAAMGTALALLIKGPPLVYVVALGTLSVVLEIFVKYDSYVRYLKWLTLVLFAYVGTAFAARVDWGQALHNLVLPKLQFNARYLTGIIAIFGSTISPYLFFWQAAQEVEVKRETPGAKTLKNAPQQALPEFKRIHIDTTFGMALSQIIAFFIMLTAAATLPALGLKEVPTATEAARALRPITGDFAFFLFTLGIVGTGLLAIPALAGATAYAVAETLKWPEGLARTPLEAKGFYAVIAVTMLIGAGFGLMEINPMQALYVSAVINGFISVPIMVVILFLGSKKEVMGAFTLPIKLKFFGWLATTAMGIAAIGLIITWFL